MVYLLGIDAGTTGLKAVLFDESGRVAAVGRAEYSLLTPAVNMAEIDAEEYWRACRKAVSGVLSISNADPRDVKALSISSQGETFVPIDRDGRPLRNAIVWLDNRSEEEARIIRNRFGVEEVFKVTGQPEVVPTWPATKILWLKRNEPKVFEKTYKFLLVEDFLIYRFTGVAATEYSVVSSTLMFDIRRGQWWDDMLEFIGIDSDKLPGLMPSGKAVGNITETASKETGLTTETIMVTGAFDHAAGAVGAYNIKPGIVTETTGAALALLATTDEPVYDPKRRIPCHRHAVPGRFFLLPWCQTAGIVLRWFRDEFGQTEKDVAEKLGVDAYDLLTLEASKIPPGSNGIVVLPHFMGAGPPEFDPHAKGVIFGLTLAHRRAHIIRAILESIAFMLRRNIELIEELGIEVKEVRSLGGGARSPMWNQIKADVTLKTIYTLHTEEAASLGAAILAGVGGGLFKSIEEACSRMVHLKYKYNPNYENRKTYDRLYKIYLALYNSLKDIFPTSAQ
ncbi:MAG: xylulokinase [Candidatus Bathyarchaeia archaeon]